MIDVSYLFIAFPGITGIQPDILDQTDEEWIALARNSHKLSFELNFIQFLPDSAS
jgi:hypothetical protein